MINPSSTKNNIPSISNKKVFSEKDKLKFEKIMSTRNLIKQNLESKYKLYETTKKPISISNRALNNVNYFSNYEFF